GYDMRQGLCIERGFFLQFTNCRLFRRFACFDTATRKGEPAFPRFFPALDQQEAPFAPADQRHTMNLGGNRKYGNCFHHALAMIVQTLVGNGKAPLDRLPKSLNMPTMCGRFSLTASREELEAFAAALIAEDFPPRYNIA